MPSSSQCSHPWPEKCNTMQAAGSSRQPVRERFVRLLQPADRNDARSTQHTHTIPCTHTHTHTHTHTQRSPAPTKAYWRLDAFSNLVTVKPARSSRSAMSPASLSHLLSGEPAAASVRIVSHNKGKASRGRWGSGRLHAHWQPTQGVTARKGVQHSPPHPTCDLGHGLVPTN